MSRMQPMTIESKIRSRAGKDDYPEAVTFAEKFVDDTTYLRMMRLRSPLAKPELFGVDSETLKAVHLPRAKAEKWDTPLTDIALRFEDGSLAYRLRETQRWEVWRQW